MEMQVRQRTGDPDDMLPQEGNIIIEVGKGAGGKRWAEAPKSALAGKSHEAVVEMVLNGLPPDDPFAHDMRSILPNRSYSLEMVDSGKQSRWVSRDSTVDAASVEQQRLRYAVSRDHVGGRSG